MHIPRVTGITFNCLECGNMHIATFSDFVDDTVRYVARCPKTGHDTAIDANWVMTVETNSMDIPPVEDNSCLSYPIEDISTEPDMTDPTVLEDIASRTTP